MATVPPKGQDIKMSLFQAGSYSAPKAPQNHWQAGSFPTWRSGRNDYKKEFEELKALGVIFNESGSVEYHCGLAATLNGYVGNNFSLLRQPTWPSW